jgi:hypothetical protein
MIKSEIKVLSILDNKSFIENFKRNIEKINSQDLKKNLSSIFFGYDMSNLNDESKKNFSLSYKILQLKKSNEQLFKNILELIKQTTGVDVNNVDEFFEKQNQKIKESKELSREEKSFLIRKAKALKKANLKDEDLKIKDEKFNLNNSINNYLQNYDRKIPKTTTLSPSIKEMKESGKKKEFIDELTEKEYNKQIKKEVKRAQKIGKCQASKRNKSLEFWKNLENYQ